MENQILNSPISQSKNPVLLSSRMQLSNDKDQKIYDSTEIKIAQNQNQLSSSNRTLNSEKGNSQINLSNPLDVNEQDLTLLTSKFNYCILCRMIPLISNILPCFSHLYIVSSKGSTHDFDSSRFVEVKNQIDKMPLKYIQLHLSEKDKLEWDKAITIIDKLFKKKEFGICGYNSYSYIASILNEIQFNGRNNYSMKDIFYIYIKESKYISNKGIIFNYLALLIIVIVIILLAIIAS